MFQFNRLVFAAFGVVALAGTAWAGPVDDAMNADRAFAKMAQEKGVAEAFSAYAAKDALRFIRGPVPEKGPAVIKASVAKDFADGGKLNWEPKEGVSSADGSVVTVWGRWTFNAPKCMAVFKSQ